MQRWPVDVAMKREFFVFVERDEDGMFVGEAPQLPACYSQGHTLDELLDIMKEAIELALEDSDGYEPHGRRRST